MESISLRFPPDQHGPSCRWPMTILTIPVPLLSSDGEITIRLPRYLTQEQWDQMMATLMVIRAGLVT